MKQSLHSRHNIFKVCVGNTNINPVHFHDIYFRHPQKEDTIGMNYGNL